MLELVLSFLTNLLVGANANCCKKKKDDNVKKKKIDEAPNPIPLPSTPVKIESASNSSVSSLKSAPSSAPSTIKKDEPSLHNRKSPKTSKHDDDIFVIVDENGPSPPILPASGLKALRLQLDLIEKVVKIGRKVETKKKPKAKKIDYESSKASPNKSKVGFLVIGAGNAQPGAFPEFMGAFEDDWYEAENKTQEDEMEDKQEFSLRSRLSSTDLPKRGVSSIEPINNWGKFPPIRDAETTDIMSSAIDEIDNHTHVKEPTNPKISNDKADNLLQFYKKDLPGFKLYMKRIVLQYARIEKVIYGTGNAWPDFDWDQHIDFSGEAMNIQFQQYLPKQLNLDLGSKVKRKRRTKK